MAVMLDSGAFSVWKSGASIDLGAYIEFCKDHPEVDYYVSLDVIPQGDRPTQEECQRGWDNYRTMASQLSPEKVLPVFHMGEDPSWLRKYLTLGCGYIGLGGLAGNASSDQKEKWLRSVKPHLFDGDRPKVKLHGFGMTSFELMRFWRWYSVDSTTWYQHSMVYQVLVPKVTLGRSDYSKPPIPVSVSPRVSKGKLCYARMAPAEKRWVDDHLKGMGTEVGSVNVYKLGPGDVPEFPDLWCDKKLRTAMETVTPGVCNDSPSRMRVNAEFYRRLVSHYPLDKLYLAGAVGCSVQDEPGDYLASYNDLKARKGRVYTAFLKLIGRG